MAILPDVLAPGLDLVFCGTAASRISAQRGHPYANPGNRFWSTLRELSVVPADFDPVRFRDLPQFGLGYTDLNKVQIGVDSELDPALLDAAAVRRKLRRHRPRLLAFTSKNAGAIFFGTRTLAFGRQPADFLGIEVFVLPSPSGLAKSHWDIGPWRALASRLGEIRR